MAPPPAPRPQEAAVSVRGLRKSYGTLKAVDGVDLEISRGEVFALLGPNGAGKTTTVEILEGFRHRDEGEVTVLGHDPGHERKALKPHIGIVLQSTGIDRYLTVAEVLTMYAGYYPHPRSPEEVIELVGLGAKKDARVTTLSGGQQRRLDVGVALVGDPELLFLDEPTTGFDPSARREAWQVVKSLAELGKTVLLTTHYMDEAQFLADRVAVIAAGRIVALGRPPASGGANQANPRVSFRLPPAGSSPRRPPLHLGPGRARRGRHREPHGHPLPSHRLGHGPWHRARRPERRPAHARGRLPRADGRDDRPSEAGPAPDGPAGNAGRRGRAGRSRAARSR